MRGSSHTMPPVIRSRTFSQLMAHLALVAMLLMALAPTISRSLQAGSDSVGAMMGASQMCTAAGLQSKLFAAFLPDNGVDQSGAGQPASDPHNPGDACGYCSMVTPIPVLLLLLCALLALHPVAPQFRPHVFSARVLRNLRGLGSQAPPVAL